MRITHRVFTDLAIWMTGFGLLMGVVFPFFVLLMGIPSEFVMKPWFFATCMIAGLLVGAANIWLAKAIVGKRLRILADRMNYVKTNLLEIANQGDMEKCTPENCFIEGDSDDEIGESARAFNRLVQALADSFRDVFAVRMFTEMLTSHLHLEKLADKAIEQLIQHTNANAGAVLIEENGELRVAASIGIKNPARLAENDHVKRAFDTKVGKRLTLPTGIVVEGVLAEFRPKETCVASIVYKGAAIGVIVLASAAGFITEEINRLELFRQGLALALHNALIHDRLQRLAAIDPLTGVFNRRFGMIRFHEEYGRAVRANIQLGVVMFDIDWFKKVNDTYGHMIGDRVLIMVAKTARSALREGDVLLRYGGEEFLAILPAASSEDIMKIAERMRRLVEDQTVKADDTDIRITISAGGVSFPETDVRDEMDLIKKADEALYMAKNTGRNRVVVL
ncbi:diguanylate cyclase [Dissulfurimicrobium hydrothermale]|uniref:diguanylate cyclase n=1 Tax=Dissulfurimicrobium hydrothermale TaxID=1750598 RepID=UPI001EDB7968|nr:diguanylate cyclase [Dissulfurimicrobium hydrothermale]UKL14144.1 GGDEF domain-containing protein [Dissulfurimicrobium hydrothermale]